MKKLIILLLILLLWKKFYKNDNNTCDKDKLTNDLLNKANIWNNLSIKNDNVIYKSVYNNYAMSHLFLLKEIIGYKNFIQTIDFNIIDNIIQTRNNLKINKEIRYLSIDDINKILCSF